ncbi:MAG: hypothetical protein AB7S38_31920 [Vulcanimicrobiota bacterium]
MDRLGGLRWGLYIGDTAIAQSLERLTLTHPGRRMAEAGRLFAELLWEVVHGADLEQLLRDRLARQDSPFLGALLGANNGPEAFPASWREGLRPARPSGPLPPPGATRLAPKADP